jgi:AcrR family transcriptional regulator
MTQASRKRTSTQAKRDAILAAARRVFESEGLEGASLRSIAAAAGYTPAALYFHFDSKEALYGEILHQAIANCLAAIEAAIARVDSASGRLRAGAMAFFTYFAENPRDLDLGFYLFRGGMRPNGLGHERDRALNAALWATLEPIAVAARELGAPEEETGLLTADVFAHATGLLLLAHTGRIRMFGASPDALMERYLDERIAAMQPQ